MESDELFKELSAILKVQYDTFSKLELMQKSILKLMDNAINFSELMNLLGHKEKLVLGVAQLSEDSRPLIGEWMQRKEELIESENYNKIDELLNHITLKVESIKEMDELMTTKLNPPRKEDEDPTDILNAYRALL